MDTQQPELLLGKTLTELKGVVASLGMPTFAAKQLADWLYKKKVATIDEMTNVSLKHREAMKIRYAVGRTAPLQQQCSVDGTNKYLFPAGDARFVETVYIPDKERATLCVSSQVGCKMNCLFCMTGKQGFNGQLSAAEILNQVLSVPETDSLTNIVFMGMGEPMDNLDPLFHALEILTADYGFGWSPKRITVSTIGLIPGLRRFLEESLCHLAVSLHSPYHDERLSLMPVEKAFPALEVLDLIRQYDFAHQRRVSFEYILFGGLNDSPAHAAALVRLLAAIPCRVNLIRYHRIPGIDLPGTDEQAMLAFRDALTAKGVICTIRSSRGEDIMAACGMLSTSACRPQ